MENIELVKREEIEFVEASVQLDSSVLNLTVASTSTSILELSVIEKRTNEEHDEDDADHKDDSVVNISGLFKSFFFSLLVS